VTALTDHLHQVLARDPPAPDAALRAALDRMYRALPEYDEAARDAIVSILKAALTRLRAQPEDAPAAREQLWSASDDEIFAFIDTQL
jgi:hypothetical protein